MIQQSYSHENKASPASIKEIEEVEQTFHHFINTMITENVVFLKFPVQEENSIRMSLPAFKDPQNEIHIWTIVKNFLGQDLSKITMPIELNLPQSMLQKMVEFLEYENLLKIANETEDRGYQCALILSCFIITFANTVGSVRKPFNPLLGETYEFYDPITQTHLVCEQVSHHPPITAYYAENSHFKIDGYGYVKLNLSLKGVKAINKGKTIITLKKTNERYLVKQPDMSVHNLIIGELYSWTEGLAYCKNLDTNDEAQIQLPTTNFWGKNNDSFTGHVIDKDKNELYQLHGNWQNQISFTDKNGTKQIVQVNLKPQNWKEQYCLSQWSINSNNLSKEMLYKLPPTDTRFRPDIRAYEYGDIKLGAQEKHRLEQKQRQKRKEMKEANSQWIPLWFDFELKDNEVIKCEFNRKYFECKKQNAWPINIDDLYNQIFL